MLRIIVLLFVLTFQVFYSQQNTTVTPVIPEIISQIPTVRDFTLSPSQDEIYFTAQGYSGELSTIVKVAKKDGQWSSPQVASFSGQYRDLEAMFSPDGLRLFFVSDRPNTFSSSEKKNHDIWYVERSSLTSNWSEPKNLGAPINTEGDEFYPSIAKNGNLYFTSTAATSKGKDDIFMSEWKNGKYNQPKSLSEAINSVGYEYNSYIAPDESFLLFGGYKRKDGLGSGDLYVSYKNEGGNWSTAKNLSSEINSDKMDYCPFYDIKTNTLYFTSRRTAIQPDTTKSKSLKEILNIMNSYQNGLSRIYSTSIKLQ